MKNKMLKKYTILSLGLALAFFAVAALFYYTVPSIPSLGYNFFFGTAALYLLTLIIAIFADILLFGFV